MASAKYTARDKPPQNIPKQIKKSAQNGTKAPSVSNGWSAYKERLRGVAQKSWMLLSDPSCCSWWPFPAFLLFVEMIMNLVIIEKVNYTEIAWKAYMQVNH